MNERPKIKPELTPIDRTIEILGWTLIAAIWILATVNYSNLPDTIPIHFNAKGEADRFGGKEHLFTLPIVATILYIGLTTLNQYPYLFNYPMPITRKNALRQYKNATRLLRYLKAIIVSVFGVITLQVIRSAHGKTDGLGIWVLPLIAALIMLPIIIFVIRSIKSEGKKYSTSRSVRNGKR